MAHFAEIYDGTVTRVIVAASQEWCEQALGGKWVQTSYNTRGGIHYGPDGQPDGGEQLRKNYAGIGYTYDETRDAFIPPQPFPSWTLNEDSCLWDAPVAYPTDGGIYSWDEASLAWIAVTA